MGWAASILSKEVSGDRLSVTVEFSSDSLPSFQRVLTTTGVPEDGWLENNIQAIINNAAAVSAYADTVVLGDDSVVVSQPINDVI